jgi:O-antigen ligase
MIEPLPLSQPEPRAGHIAITTLAIGAVAVGLAATPYFVFDLDRFLIPKELVLHLTALLAGLFALRAMRQSVTNRVDTLLDLYLLLSALSAALATNRWLAFRGLAISVSSVVLFRVGRALQPHALGVIRAIAAGTTVIAATSLLQAYGLRITLFSINRAPGGTLGNRNFVAHAVAFGLPLAVLALMRATKRATWGYVSIAMMSAALVLTRSRAAWLATGVMLVVFFGALIASGALRERVARNRLLLAIVVAAIAVGAALILPNALHWRSDNPYLESLQGITKYGKGSAHGRLIQYRQSLDLALHHPLLGCGPGNWAVDYPRFAARDDPSLDSNDNGMTTNPWPSSDWIAFIAERGVAATACLALALLMIALTAESAALLGVLAAVVVAGAFDALLLLPAPALLVWPVLGVGQALLPVRTGKIACPTWILLLVVAAGVARSSAQLVSMSAYVNHSSLEHASHIDPSNYRLQMRLAHVGKRSERCEHARAAHELYPQADAARELSRPCAPRK